MNPPRQTAAGKDWPADRTCCNYTTGDYVNVATTVPAVLTNFNVIV